MPSDKQIAREIESAYERGFKDGRISALASQLVGLHEEQAVRETAEEIRRVGDRFREPQYVDTILPTDALAAARQPEQGAWQPIETAPKDGTEILLAYFGFVMDVAVTFVANSYWLPACIGSPLLGTNDHCVCCPDNENYTGKWKNWELTCAYEPTHWMPLPAAPTETAASAAQEFGYTPEKDSIEPLDESEVRAKAEKYLNEKFGLSTPPEGELLPCPFCGATAGDVKLSRGHGFIIGCSSCQGQQFALERDEAVRMWNTRALPAAQPPEGYKRRLCSKCGEGLGFSESDPCEKCSLEQLPEGELISREAMPESVAEALNVKLRCDIMDIVMNLANGRATAGETMDKVAERCNAAYEAGRALPAAPAECLMTDCTEPQAHFCVTHVLEVHAAPTDEQEK